MTNRLFRALAGTFAALLLIGGLSSCKHDSDNVSHNLSQEADQYHVYRDIVVYNTFTDKPVLEVQGYCSLGNDDPSYAVTYTCKTPDGYIKDIIHKSDNSVIYEHQLYPNDVPENFFKVTFNPTLPSLNLG